MKTKLHFLELIESRLGLYIIGVIFRLLLELSYRDFVHPIYEYAGFSMEDNPEKYIESWVLYFGMLMFLPEKTLKPSDYLIGLAFFCFMAPLLVFYGFADHSRWALYYVLIQYGIVNLVRGGRTISIPLIKNGPAIALGVTVTIIGMATVWMVASIGFSNFNLDLDAVYDYREYANINIFTTGAMGYISVWATTVCGPVVLTLALRDRRYMLALGIFFLHVFWFGITSHKSVLFHPLLVLAIYTVFRYSRAVSLVPLGLSVVVLFSLYTYYSTESLFLSGTIVRRVFFVPAHLTFTYFEYFETNPFVFWSNSFLSWFIRYPYDDWVALMIGRYLNDPYLWANNSFFSTGYMHAGFLGVLIYGLTVGILLKVVDSLTYMGVQLWMSLSVVIVPFYSLFTSSDLTTTLLTHGLGLAILVLYLLGQPSNGLRTEGQLPQGRQRASCRTGRQSRLSRST